MDLIHLDVSKEFYFSIKIQSSIFPSLSLSYEWTLPCNIKEKLEGSLNLVWFNREGKLTKDLIKNIDEGFYMFL